MVITGSSGSKRRGASGTGWVVSDLDAGTRLDKFLASPERLGSRSKVVTALERGKIFLNDVEASASDASSRLSAGDVVRVWMDRPGSATRKPGAYSDGDLHILYEDDALIVLNKPAGMLSVPLERRAGALSAYDRIEDHLRSSGKRRPMVVHRIDLDTSGLVVFAKNTRAQGELKAQFRRREPERVYWAVVYGHPQPAEGTWQDRLVWDEKVLIQKETHPTDPRGMDAISDYRVLEAFADTSLVEVRLQTGKRNQIRIQARLRGHTLVGERRYVFGPDTLRPIAFGRQALHAYRLSFLHPTSGQPVTFEAPLPQDFSDLLARLRRHKKSG
jgi:23S rRNA pseudouridine1911/1915/1917 synthase